MDTVNPNPAVVQPTVTPPAPKSIWAKGIPRTNWAFMIISLLLVFGLDLSILFSSFDLMQYWIVMLIVFGVFAFFFLLENYLFSKKFANTKSGLDPWIFAIIAVRNVVFVLNFIPLIQLLGIMLLGGLFVILEPLLMASGVFVDGDLSSFGSTPYALIMPGLLGLYIILIVARFATLKR